MCQYFDKGHNLGLVIPCIQWVFIQCQLEHKYDKCSSTFKQYWDQYKHVVLRAQLVPRIVLNIEDIVIVDCFVFEDLVS